MTFSLSSDQIAILADPVETKTESGLHIPENSGIDNKKPRYGTVVHVGYGRRSEANGEIIPIDFEVGDRVFFHRMHDNVLEIEGTEYLVLKPHEIWGTSETKLESVK